MLEIRRRVYARRGGTCRYCGRVLLLHEVELDHDLVGTHSEEVPEQELHCACSPCRQEKGERTAEEYHAHRRMRHAHEMLAGLGGAGER
jgi:5-methylcytosine-specific restriction endonuclease McrA